MAMKRKSSAPSRVDDAKRCELSWSMSDLFGHADNRFLLHHSENCKENSEIVSVEDNKSKDSPISLEEFPLDEKLHRLIDGCDFYVRVCGKASASNVNDDEWHGLLGQVELKLSDTPLSVFTFLSCLMEHIKEFWLYVDTTAGKHLMYIPLDKLSEFSVSEASIADSIGMTKKVVRRRNSSESYEVSSALYFSVETEMPASYFDGLQSKKEFLVKVSSCSLQRGTVVVNIYVLEAAVFEPNFACDVVKPRRCHFALQRLVHHFYGINEQCKSLLTCWLLWSDCCICIIFVLVSISLSNTAPKLYFWDSVDFLQANQQHRSIERTVLRGQI